MESRLSSLLTSNDPPSEDEIQNFHRLMAAPLQELRAIDQKIADLQALLALLEDKREGIYGSLQRFIIVMSPIRRLPDDVLSEIFYQCLPTDRPPILGASDAPTLLMRVCKRWRSVVLSSPRLWAQLSISFSGEDSIYGLPGSWQFDADGKEWQQRAESTLNRRLEIITEWLARSGTCPLSL
ncbi:hypothetical protein CPB84DRAFT_1683195, partial [Gymnopilus junonius]